MRMANNAFRLKRTIVPTCLGLPVFDSFRTALRRWREREKLRAQLNRLADRELRDIGITRAEADFLPANPMPRDEIDILAANRFLLPPF